MKRLVLIAGLCASCVSSSPAVDLEGEDLGSIGWEMRARLPGEASPWEVFVTGREGEDEQELRAGETLDLGVDFDGPQTVESELRLGTYGVAYHHTLTESERGGVDVVGGVGIASVDLDVRGDSLSVGLDAHDPYGLLGVEGWYDLTGDVRAWYRIELPVLSTDTSVGSTELGVGWRVGEVRLRLGWRHSEVEVDRVGSDVEYTLSGLVFGVGVGW